MGGERIARIMDIISVNDVEYPNRGRNIELIEGLADKLNSIKPGQGIALTNTFGRVEESDRDRIANIIKKHWKIVRNDKPQITFSEEGIPRVTIRKF